MDSGFLENDSFFEELDSELGRIRNEINSSKRASSGIRINSTNEYDLEAKTNSITGTNSITDNTLRTGTDASTQIDPQASFNSFNQVEDQVRNQAQINQNYFGTNGEPLPILALLVFEGGVGGATIPDPKKRLATMVLPAIPAKSIYLVSAGYDSFEGSIQALLKVEQKVKTLLSVQGNKFTSLIELIKAVSKTIDETTGCEGIFLLLDMAANEIKSASNEYYLGADAIRFGSESNEGFVRSELLIEYYNILATDYPRVIIIENGFAVEDFLAWNLGRMALKDIGLLPDRRIIKVTREDLYKYKENYLRKSFSGQNQVSPYFYGTDFLISPKTNVELRVSRTTLTGLINNACENRNEQIKEKHFYPPGSLGSLLNYIPKKTFMGTSGFRGKASDMRDFEPYVVTGGFIKWLLKKGQYKFDEKTKLPSVGQSMLLAGDFRDSTPAFTAATARAINDFGINIIYLGSVATPVLAFYSKSVKLPGIMITGSHTEGQYNGLKLYDFDGEVLNDPEPEDNGISDREGIMREVDMVREQFYSEQFSSSIFSENGYFKPEKRFSLDDIVVNDEAKENYVQRYVNAFSEKPFEGYALIYWAHSTVAAREHIAILEGLGMKVLPIGKRADAFIALDTENMTPTHLNYLHQKVQEIRENYSFRETTEGKIIVSIEDKEYVLLGLVSSDGDGDRSLIVDEKGRFWRGDVTGAIVAQTIGAEVLVQSLTSSQDVENYLVKCSPPIKLESCSVGSPYHVFVMRRLLRQFPDLRVVGQEANGGAFIGPNFKLPLSNKEISELLTRDSILPIIIVLLRAVIGNVPVSKLFENKLDHYADCAGLIHEMPIKPGTDRIGTRILKRYTPDSNLGIKEIYFEDENQKAVLKHRNKPNQEEVPYSTQLGSTLVELRNNMQSFFSEAKGFGKIIKMGFGERIEDGIIMWDSNDDKYHIRPSGNAPETRIYAYSKKHWRAKEIVELSTMPNGILREIERTIWNPKEILDYVKLGYVESGYASVEN